MPIGDSGGAMRSKKWIAIGAGWIWASSNAQANENVTYTYDALGRLVQSQTSGGPGNGVSGVYQYDAAGNRTQYQVSGSSGESAVTLSMSNTTVNLTATGATLALNVSASSASGTIDLTENGVFLGSTWVTNGHASVNLQGLSKGTHTITATYSGDGTNAAQTTTFTVKVQDLRWLPAVLDLLLSN
jgi:hypothetical protein